MPRARSLRRQDSPVQQELFGDIQGKPRPSTPPLPLGEGRGEGNAVTVHSIRYPTAEAHPGSKLSLETNLAVAAGAGAGKTHSLVGLCLQLLAGARAGGTALRPSQLFMLTFTDKAAAEMRARLRQRVDGLARGQAPEDERLLLRSLQEHSRSLPPKASWRSVQENLGASTIGTFHSLCAQLLREAAPANGLDGAFQVMEERDAQELLQRSAERVVLEALERQDPGAATLCRALDFAARGYSLGLVEQLSLTLLRLREEGLSPQLVSISNLEDSRAGFQSAVAHTTEAVLEAIHLDWAGRCRGALDQCRRALEGMTLDNFLQPDRFPLLRRMIKSDPRLTRIRNGPSDALRELKQCALGMGSGRLGLADFYGACVVVPCEEAFRSLLTAFESRYRSELRHRGAIDFAELLIRTRDLLQGDLAVRRQVQARMGALLVDEFQDTNLLQLEIVTLLAEKRVGGPRSISPLSLGDGSASTPPLPLGEGRGEGKLPLEPGFLCVVGDRKQSIYEFRGADVAVFGQIADKIEREGGRRAYLSENRRSSPNLLKAFNTIFARLMRESPDARDYEVAYQPERDDQTALRVQRRDTPCIDWLVFDPSLGAEECRLKDAEGLARRIGQLLSPGAPALVETEDGSLRKPQGGDIAILFRRFTFLEGYRQALTRHGIPHRVIRGRGFYGAQEVMDLASLLYLVADPSDAVAFAAVLRSPWVALSDASLFKLATSAGGRLSLQGLPDEGRLAELSLPSDETERLRRFLRLHRQLRRERDRLGMRVLLRVALEETGFRTSLAGAPFGEQALVNVDRALEIAGRWDATGKGDAPALASYLMALTDDVPFEAHPEEDSHNSRAVQLLTIHQAKGLEWPIVAIPDLAGQRIRSTARILFDRRLGLAIKPSLPDELEIRRSPRVQEIWGELGRRDEAEYLRLLYVALTRAQDHLILSGQTDRPGGTWREMLEQLIRSEPSLASLVAEIDVDTLPAGRPMSAPSPDPSPESVERLEAAVKRVRDVKLPSGSTAVFPVTHLQDYFLCPRRYLYARQLGLSEFPIVYEVQAETEEELPGRSAGDHRMRGTLVHRILEQVDLRLVHEPNLLEHVRSLLWTDGLDPSAPDTGEILQSILAFLKTPFASRISARPERVHRELPFLLRLAGEEEKLAVYLKGQIDLLFEEEDGSATIVDYKTSVRHPAGLSPYAFQLDCYALAGSRFVQTGVSIRTGIAFLREGNPEPEMRPAGEVASKALERKLILGAQQLLGATRSLDWPGLPQAECAAIACGYQYRCHASPG